MTANRRRRHPQNVTPSPEVAVRVAEGLGLDPGEVTDLSADYDTARPAKHAVVVTWTARRDMSLPDFLRLAGLTDEDPK